MFTMEAQLAQRCAQIGEPTVTFITRPENMFRTRLEKSFGDDWLEASILIWKNLSSHWKADECLISLSLNLENYTIMQQIRFVTSYKHICRIPVYQSISHDWPFWQAKIIFKTWADFTHICMQPRANKKVIKNNFCLARLMSKFNKRDKAQERQGWGKMSVDGTAQLLGTTSFTVWLRSVECDGRMWAFAWDMAVFSVRTWRNAWPTRYTADLGWSAESAIREPMTWDRWYLLDASKLEFCLAILLARKAQDLPKIESITMID